VYRYRADSARAFLTAYRSRLVAEGFAMTGPTPAAAKDFSAGGYALAAHKRGRTLAVSVLPDASDHGHGLMSIIDTP
jgi:hypothetical protein